MSLKRYSGGVWTDCASIKKYSAGAWADCQSVKKYSGGAWGNVWEGTASVKYSEKKSSGLSDYNRFAYKPSGKEVELIIDAYTGNFYNLAMEWKPKVFAYGDHTFSIEISALDGAEGKYMNDYIANIVIEYVEPDDFHVPIINEEIYPDKIKKIATTKFTLPSGSIPELNIMFQYIPISSTAGSPVRVFYRNLVIDGKNINFGGENIGYARYW